MTSLTAKYQPSTLQGFGKRNFSGKRRGILSLK